MRAERAKARAKSSVAASSAPRAAESQARTHKALARRCAGTRSGSSKRGSSGRVSPDRASTCSIRASASAYGRHASSNSPLGGPSPSRASRNRSTETPPATSPTALTPLITSASSTPAPTSAAMSVIVLSTTGGSGLCSGPDRHRPASRRPATQAGPCASSPQLYLTPTPTHAAVSHEYSPFGSAIRCTSPASTPMSPSDTAGS